MLKRNSRNWPLSIEWQLVAGILVTAAITIAIILMFWSGPPKHGGDGKFGVGDLVLFSLGLSQFLLSYFLRWRWPLITCSELEERPNRFSHGELFVEVILRTSLVLLAIVVFTESLGNIDLGGKKPWLFIGIIFIGYSTINIVNHLFKLKCNHPCTDFTALESAQNRIPWQRKAMVLSLTVILCGLLRYGTAALAELYGFKGMFGSRILDGAAIVVPFLMYSYWVNIRPRLQGD